MDAMYRMLGNVVKRLDATEHMSDNETKRVLFMSGDIAERVNVTERRSENVAKRIDATQSMSDNVDRRVNASECMPGNESK